MKTLNPKLLSYVTGVIIGKSALAKQRPIHLSEQKMFDFSDEQKKAIRAALECKDLSKDNYDIIKDMLISNIDDIKVDQLQNKIQAEENACYNHAKLFVDGASDLRTETAGIGGVLYNNGQEIDSFAYPLYAKTNNEAEYLSLIKGIEVSLSLKIKNLAIYADSELVVRQVMGVYKVKNTRMQKLHKTVMEKLNKLAKWKITHVRREENERADELSKIGLDEARSQKL